MEGHSSDWENLPVETIEELLYLSGVSSLDREGIPTRYRSSIIAPEEVRLEIEKVDDDLHKWVRDRGAIFMPPTEDVQKSVIDILASHPRLVDDKRGRSLGDPWVIAQACVDSAVVVTEENAGGGRSPKIPDVCEHLGVPYTNVLGLIRAMGLRF